MLTHLDVRIVAPIDTLIGAVNTFIAAGQIDASDGRAETSVRRRDVLDPRLRVEKCGWRSTVTFSGRRCSALGTTC